MSENVAKSVKTDTRASQEGKSHMWLHIFYVTPPIQAFPVSCPHCKLCFLGHAASVTWFWAWRRDIILLFEHALAKVVVAGYAFIRAWDRHPHRPVALWLANILSFDLPRLQYRFGWASVVGFQPFLPIQVDGFASGPSSSLHRAIQAGVCCPMTLARSASCLCLPFLLIAAGCGGSPKRLDCHPLCINCQVLCSAQHHLLLTRHPLLLPLGSLFDASAIHALPTCVVAAWGVYGGVGSEIPWVYCLWVMLMSCAGGVVFYVRVWLLSPCLLQ